VGSSAESFGRGMSGFRMPALFLALFGPLLGSLSELMGLDGAQWVLIFQGTLSKTALGLSGYMPSHGRGRRFKSSPAYQKRQKERP
jgi:hypothetical protein